MKKILIALLAMMVVFGFVACDDSSSSSAPAKAVAMDGDTSVGIFADGKTVADFQKDVEISADGAVSGTFMYGTCEKWGVDTEDEGYYICVKFDVADTDTVKVGSKEAVDDEWMLFIGDDNTDDKLNDKEFAIQVKGADDAEFSELITLSFKNATFEPKA